MAMSGASTVYVPVLYPYATGFTCPRRASRRGVDSDQDQRAAAGKNGTVRSLSGQAGSVRIPHSMRPSAIWICMRELSLPPCALAPEDDANRVINPEKDINHRWVQRFKEGTLPGSH